METMSKVPLDFALIQCLAFRRFCKVERMQWDIIGQGGGRVGGVEETWEYCLCQQWHIFGHVRGRELAMDRIGEVCIFGWGGGRCPTVFLAGVYLPFPWG